MKKNISKIFALLLALMMALSLAACGGEGDAPSSNPSQSGGGQSQQPGDEPGGSGGSTTDWSHFEDWQSENWDSKTVSYQFTGEWSLEEYDIFNYFLINFYSDGSVVVEQYNPGGMCYEYFGYWSEENTADGNEISLDTVYVTPDNGVGALVVHEYHYDLYEESDGGYSFGYTFGISAGAYFRDVDVAGSSAVTYATIAAFKAAMDEAVPSGGEDGGDEPSGGDETPVEGAIATYSTESGLSLILFADGTMRVEFPQYDMARDGFTYELSEDGTTLTVTGTPDEEAMGGFAAVWQGAGATVWTIDGTTATPA